MANYDGQIRINTQISVADAKMQLKQLQAELARVDKVIERNRKNLSKISPKVSEYESEKAAIRKSTDVDLSRAETRAQVESVLAIEQAQLDALDAKYADVLSKQKEYEESIREATRRQSELTGKINEAQDALDKATIAEKQAANAKKEQVAAERESVRLARQAERASKRLERSANRVGRKLLSWGTAMLAVRGVIGILRKSVQAFLSDNENVANQLNSIWSAIGNALGPIIMRIIGLIQTLFAAISAFVKALTGIDLVANYNAKALDKQAAATAGAGAAAEKAERQLAGFDEVNKLTDTSSGGGGGGGGGGLEIPSLLDDIDSWLVDFATKLGLTVKDVFFDWFESMTEEDIAQKLLVLLGALSGGAIGFFIGGVPGALIGIAVGAVLTLGIASTIFDHDGILDDSEVLTSIMTALGGMVGGVIGFAIVSGPVGAAIGITVGAILTVALMNKVNWENFGLLADSSLLTESQRAVSDYSHNVGLEFGNLVYNLAGGFDEIDEKVDAWADNVLETLSTWANNAKTTVGNKFQELSDSLDQFWDQIDERVDAWATNTISTFTSALETAKQKFDGFKEKIISVYETIRSKFSALGSAIGSAISGAVRTAINNVLNKIQSTINSAINIINGAIGVINLLPGVSVGYLSYVYLPRLARGGIVNNPGMGVPAVIGEAGAEAVLPLERHTEWMDTLADKIASRGGAGGQIVVPIYLSGKKIGEYIADMQTQQAFAKNMA